MFENDKNSYLNKKDYSLNSENNTFEILNFQNNDDKLMQRDNDEIYNDKITFKEDNSIPKDFKDFVLKKEMTKMDFMNIFKNCFSLEDLKYLEKSIKTKIDIENNHINEENTDMEIDLNVNNNNINDKRANKNIEQQFTSNDIGDNNLTELNSDENISSDESDETELNSDEILYNNLMELRSNNIEYDYFDLIEMGIIERPKIKKVYHDIDEIDYDKYSDDEVEIVSNKISYNESDAAKVKLDLEKMHEEILKKNAEFQSSENQNSKEIYQRHFIHDKILKNVVLRKLIEIKNEYFMGLTKFNIVIISTVEKFNSICLFYNINELKQLRRARDLKKFLYNEYKDGGYQFIDMFVKLFNDEDNNNNNNDNK